MNDRALSGDEAVFAAAKSKFLWPTITPLMKSSTRNILSYNVAESSSPLLRCRSWMAGGPWKSCWWRLQPCPCHRSKKFKQPGIGNKEACSWMRLAFCFAVYKLEIHSFNSSYGVIPSTIFHVTWAWSENRELLTVSPTKWNGQYNWRHGHHTRKRKLYYNCHL